MMRRFYRRKHVCATPMHMKLTEHSFKKLYRGEALIKQGYKCTYCKEPIRHDNATADHLIPVASGGMTDQANIKAACLPCNQAKGKMTEAEFRKALHRWDVPIGNLPLMRAWLRFRLNRRIQKAEKRIQKFVGMLP